MAIDATFWVAISFIIFIGVLVYFKIPQKVSQMLDGMISDIKNEIDESEKLRTEAKTLLDNSQKKLNTATSISNEILENAKKESDKLIIDLNDKFHKSSEIKKSLAENKISQMKEAALKEINLVNQNQIVGTLMLQTKSSIFKPENDIKKNYWFTLNREDILEFTGRNFSEYIIYLNGEYKIPKPRVITAKISNNHKKYAITWFSMAISILLIYLYFRKKNY